MSIARRIAELYKVKMNAVLDHRDPAPRQAQDHHRLTEAGITAVYKDGVLEIRIPEPKREETKKIAISKS